MAEINRLDLQIKVNDDLLLKLKEQKKELERLQELCEVQKELIKFYGQNISDKAGYLLVHGIRDSEEDIQKGIELRQRIEELTKQIKTIN